MAETKDVKQLIIEAIQDFAGSNIVFSNESQFQFDLAWKLRSIKEISDKYDIKLEVLGISKEKTEDTDEEKDKKNYVDLLLVSNKENKEKEIIPIELKYKTPQKDIRYYNNQGKEIGRTFSQGAPDVGSYLFWKDVERIERILGLCEEKDKIIIEEYCDYERRKGFAILLTNNPSYLSANSGLYKEFFPYKDHVVDYNNPLCAYVYVNNEGERCKKENARKENPTERVEPKVLDKYNNLKGFNNSLLNPIILKGTYKCTWVPYKLDGCYYIANDKKYKLEESVKRNTNGFFFLILQVDKQ